MAPDKDSLRLETMKKKMYHESIRFIIILKEVTSRSKQKRT